MSARRTLALAAVAGLVLGSATSLLQTVLPYDAAPLANSAGSWCLVAFLLALPSERLRVAALVSPVALTGFVAGYYATAGVRGFAVGTSSIAFWTLAAVLVGPVLGASAYLLRHGSGPVRLLAALPMPGVLVLEAVSGLTVNSASTSAAYWISQIAVALVVTTLSLTEGFRAVR